MVHVGDVTLVSGEASRRDGGCREVGDDVGLLAYTKEPSSIGESFELADVQDTYSWRDFRLRSKGEGSEVKQERPSVMVDLPTLTYIPHGRREDPHRNPFLIF